MKLSSILILILLLLTVTFSGCSPIAGPGEGGLEGLTVGDLRPAGEPERSVDSVVSVHAYQVSAEKAAQIPDQLKMLSTQAVEYGSREGLRANGLWAALGDATQTAEVRQQLAQLGEYVGQSSYLMFEEEPESLGAYPVAHGQSLSYYRADGSAAVREVPSGDFSLLFRLGRSAAESSSVELSLVPYFESVLTQQLKKMGRPAGDDDFAVEEASLKATMREGDFLVLAVTEDQRSVNSLHWFFRNPIVREGNVLLYLILYADAGGE